MVSTVFVICFKMKIFMFPPPTDEILLRRYETTNTVSVPDRLKRAGITLTVNEKY